MQLGHNERTFCFFQRRLTDILITGGNLMTCLGPKVGFGFLRLVTLS